jgi:hypothetical protein
MAGMFSITASANTLLSSASLLARVRRWARSNSFSAVRRFSSLVAFNRLSSVPTPE